MKHMRWIYQAGTAALILSLAMMPATVLATDGMNLEGYGPIATGMGGASMAYDNGAAAMMNNPATLGLMPAGDRLDVALGYLGPHIKASSGPFSSESTATAFYMPAIGWVEKSGNASYGIGMFAQGGMGTQYEAGSFLTAGSPELVRSELSVGRLLLPVAYEVNPKLKIGGTVDFVWAGLDLKMALDGQSFLGMAGGASPFGSASGSMLQAFNGFVGMGAIDATNPVNWARFDFSNDNDFTGKAQGTGYAGKIGAVYKVTDALSVGATYHSKTALSDLKTSGATVSFNANVDSGIAQGLPPTGVFVPGTIPLTGTLKVKDFEWPQMAGLGAAYNVTSRLMVAFDYKWINWANTMKNFKVEFTADTIQPGLAQGFAGTVLDVNLVQKWKDQNVFMLGAAYAVSDMLTLRVGGNFANNPIPDFYMNPLFPAIIRNHFTVGAGIMATKQSSVDMSVTYAPDVKATNGQGITVHHYQANGQVMYSYRF